MVYAIDINPTTFPAARYATIGSLLSTILPLFIIVMALAFLAFLMKGAFLWVIAEGDKKKHEDARKTIEYSIWGMFLVTISFVLVKVITAIFHIDQLFR